MVQAVHIQKCFAKNLRQARLFIYVYRMGKDLKIMLAAAAVVGHVFPVYVGFKGGKGIATLLGVGLALFPTASLIAIIVFVMVLLVSGYVSLGSIIAAVTFPLSELVILGHTEYISLTILSISVAVFVPLTHRKNIQRLLKGEETKFTLKKKKAD